MYKSREGFALAEKQYGAPLAACLEHEELHRDILDGLVTRAAMYYGTGQQELALRQIPETLHRSPPPNGVKGENAWFAVCVLQGILLRGELQEFTYPTSLERLIGRRAVSGSSWQLGRSREYVQIDHRIRLTGRRATFQVWGAESLDRGIIVASLRILHHGPRRKAPPTRRSHGCLPSPVTLS